MSWTNDIVLEFLELYKREPHLWDPKHPLHRNRSEVSDAWQRIQSSLSANFTIIDLKRKKESLMTSFRMHFSRKRKSQDEYRTTWFAYPLMESFLGGKYECDSTNQLEHEFFNNSGSYNAQPQQTMAEHNVIQTYNPLEKTNITRQTKPTTYPTTNAKMNTELIYAKKQMDDAVTYLKSAAGEKKDMDECELYGQLLAKKLRKLDEHQRDMAMHEIDNIMFRAKMQNSSSVNRSYSSSPSPVPRKTKSPIFIVAPQNQPQYEDENIPYQEHMQPQSHT